LGLEECKLPGGATAGLVSIKTNDSVIQLDALSEAHPSVQFDSARVPGADM